MSKKRRKIEAQCHCCQQFQYTKTYCTRQPLGVKCGKSHLTTNCKMSFYAPACCTPSTTPIYKEHWL